MAKSRTLALLAQYPARARTWWKVRCTQHILLSFPKCGRTWLRHMLSVYRDETPTPDLSLGLASGKLFYPTLVTHGGTDFIGARGYLPTGKLERNVRAMAGKNILFLIRDPRDVVVSFYHEATTRHSRGTGRAFTMSEFVRHEGFGVRYIIDFFRLVHDHRKLFQTYLLLRYEDLQADPKTNLSHAVQFLSREDKESGDMDQRLKAAVEASRFDVMKQREATGEYNTRSLQPGDPSNPQSFKVRQGKIGGYRTALSPEDCDYMDGQMEALPKEFGYF
jgi:hypothetical protein